MASIQMTIWGESFCDKLNNLKKGDIIAIKNAKVSDY